MQDHTADVVVIGGGVIGCSIAFHLALKKVGVILLDRGGFCSGASGACDGTVFMQTKKPGLPLRLAMESRRRFDWLEERLPVPIELETVGGLVIMEDEEERAAVIRHVEEQRKVGLDVRLLDPAQVRELEPHLGQHILGASYAPDDAQVNPIGLTLGFAQAARDLGARLFPRQRVVAMDTAGGRVRSVRTEAGATFSSAVVVNATGAHAPEIARLAGLDLPIKPRRGQLLVTEAAPRMLRHVLSSGRYIAVKHNPELAAAKGEGLSMEQTRNGNLLLGSTREFAGYDTSTVPEKLQAIAAQSVRVMPALGRLKMIRAFAGLRPWTPDGYPFVGPVAAVSGLIMAAGHEGDGIAFSPIMGELVAQMVVEGKTDLPLDELRADRFSGPERSERGHG